MKKWICGFMTVLFIVSYCGAVFGKTPSKSEITGCLDNIAYYELENVPNPTCASSGGEWMVMGLARYGTVTDSYLSKYKSNLKTKLDSCNGVLSKKKYTEYSRVVIALTAIGEDPQNFYGYDLLKPLAEFDNVKSQGANGIIYALIAFDCGNYTIPDPGSGYTGTKTTREKLISLILDSRLDDGGWSIMGTTSDADITAMALQALAPYYGERSDVNTAVEKGLDKLSALQGKSGGYKSSGTETCESTAQVLTALSLLKIDLSDTRFVKNGNSVYDGLMQYYDEGAFSHTKKGEKNQMATEQALYALVAKYRQISGMNGLYEMWDGITKRTLSSIGSTVTGTSKETATRAGKSAKQNNSSASKKSKSADKSKAESGGDTAKSEQEEGYTKEPSDVEKKNKNKEDLDTANENKKNISDKNKDTTPFEKLDLTDKEYLGNLSKKEEYGIRDQLLSAGILVVVCGLSAGVAVYLRRKKSL